MRGKRIKRKKKKGKRNMGLALGFPKERKILILGKERKHLGI